MPYQIPSFAKPCPKCGSNDIAVGEGRRSDETVSYPFFCHACGYVQSRYPKKADIEKMKAEGVTIPRIITKSEKRIAEGVASPKPPCEVCGSSREIEIHHWAPYHLFGEESPSWPTSHLCRTCHARWHQIVTPNMAKNGNAA